MRRTLAGEPTSGQEVRRALLAAQRAGNRLELEPAALAPEDATPMVARIEQVRAGDFIISQPSIGVFTHPLATGEQLRLSFVGSEGRVSGLTKSLGRIKIASGGTGMLYGYRLALPEALRENDERKFERMTIGFDLAPEVRLFSHDGAQAARGNVQDLSRGGMQIRCHEVSPRSAVGQRVRLDVLLPQPVGEVAAMATIVRLGAGLHSRQQIIGVEFEKEVQGLSELIGEVNTRRARRQRTG
ncbi:MAG: PilZ domain-containing protein [Planctomycetota bacterium]|nr:PilZ domain-containing protein [Planctomycetota bacterium]